MIGPRCVHCKKQLSLHSSPSNRCPAGKRSREFGYSEFSETSFQAKEPKSRGGSEKRKNREIRREVKSNPCAACGTKGTDWNPVDPAHLRTWKVTQSDHPANIIPLCRECHKMQHSGWADFFDAYPHVLILLETKGWTVWADPFEKYKFHFSHPEIA